MSERLTATNQLDEITATINDGLDFDMEYGIDEHSARGNCYEFARRAYAEKLRNDPSGNHYIAFAHDHSFNLGAASSDNGNGVYFLSADVPGFAASESDRPELNRMVEPPVAGKIRSGQISGFLATTVYLKSVEQVLTNERITRARQATKRQWYTDVWLPSTPSAAIMEADHAIPALKNYNDFRRGVYYASFELIRDGLERLRLRTPQFETRTQYNTELRSFPRVMRYFARQAIGGKLGASARDLGRLVKSYEEVLPEKNTSANVVFGDCHKVIGETFGSHKALEAAKKHYKRAGFYARTRSGRRNTLVASKLSKLDKLASGLDSRQSHDTISGATVS